MVRGFVLSNVVLLFFLFGSLIGNVDAHELCYDGSYPSASTTLAYCKEYQTLSCCSDAREQTIVSDFVATHASAFGAGFRLTDVQTWSTCDQELIKIACTRCSPYETHIFESSSLAPLLCTGYCSGDFASKCPTQTCVSFGIVSQDPWCFPVLNPLVVTSVSNMVEAFPGALVTNGIDIRWSPVETAANVASSYVASQDGVVYHLKKDPNNSARFVTRSFLDLTSRVSVQGELGLLGFHFDPLYQTNCYVYAFYTSTIDVSKKVNTLSRFYVPNCADYDVAQVNIATECKMISVTKTTTNHNGGNIDFDSNNDMFMTFGDGGTQNDGSDNGQNTFNLFGTIIRITPGRPADPYSCFQATNYTIPSTNPFVALSQDGVKMGLSEIYAYGFRNPWACAMMPDDKYYCGDVGQQRYEELDRVRLGGNYGWSLAEGDGKFAQATDSEYQTMYDSGDYERPLADYRHSGQYPMHERTIPNLLGFSIIYGGVYSNANSKLSARFADAHIFADYNEMSVGAMFIDEPQGGGSAPKPPSAELIVAESVPVSRIRIGPDGEPYFLSYQGFPSDVYKLDGSTVKKSLCGNYRCELGESCSTCPVDCSGVLTGPNSKKWCCADGKCKSGDCPVDCSARNKPSNPLNKVCEPDENCMTTDDCPSRKTGNDRDFCCYGSNDGAVCTSVVNGQVVVESDYCKTLNDPCLRGNSNGRGNGWAW